MARKRIKVSKRMLFTWGMLAGLILLLAPASITNKFPLAFARIFRWPLSIGRNISLAAITQQSQVNTVDTSEYQQLRRQYEQLQNHYTNVRERLEQVLKENEKLSGIQKRLPFPNVNFVSADITTASVSPSSDILIINCGKKEGLAKDQFVLGDNSIIGAISDVQENTATVKLLTDPSSKLVAKVDGIKEPRPLYGNGNGSACVKLVRNAIKPGANVTIEKKPGFLDSPIIAGRVKKCTKNETPLVWDLIIEPACDVRKLSDVTVIVMNPKRKQGL